MKKSRPPHGRSKAAPAPATPATLPWVCALASAFLLLVAFAVRYLSDTDLGYQLRGGQWMFEQHRFLSKDVFTYTRSSADYVDLHWLYQLLVYGTYRIGGYGSLTLLSVALVGAAFFLTLKRVQLTGAPLWMWTPLLTIALLASELR